MKILFLLFLGVAIYLIVPNYVLVDITIDENGEPSHQVIESRFISRQNCQQAARQKGLKTYQCEKRKAWEGVFSNYRKYNSQAPRSNMAN